MRSRVFLFAFLAFFTAQQLFASVLPLSSSERIQRSKAICRGTVLSQTSFRAPGGGIYTKTAIQVNEPLKGRFPEAIYLVHRGGVYNGKGEAEGFSPKFDIGEERLLFIDVNSDGTLFALDGEASAMVLHPRLLRQKAALSEPVYSAQENALLDEIRFSIPDPAAQGIDASDQTAPLDRGTSAGHEKSIVGGLLANANGVSCRFTAPDRGEPIPYFVDMQALPSGITTNQALTAVSNAFLAWSAASSARFVFAGLQNFGQAAPNVPGEEPVIRIQLHDLYGYISGSTTLGIGGRGYWIPGDFPSGGMGGNVAGSEFFETSSGYVVLKHTSPTMQNSSSFEEVLCHELGHVLSLDHSSISSPETNAMLREAIMYYTVHADGRGARLATYDTTKIELVYPHNTPPYGYSRIMDVVTAIPQPNVPGVNEVQMRGYDLQGANLQIVLTNATSNNGAFSLAGGAIRYTPEVFGNGPRLDPAETGYYDMAYVRWSDGTNSSPLAGVRVISLSADQYPSTSDGIPDSWMVQHFGNSNPNVGTKRKAADDYDGDGLSNFAEFLAGTSPTDAASALRISTITYSGVEIAVTPYQVYEIQMSTNLVSWQLARNPVTPDASTVTYSIPKTASPLQFYRVLRVP